MVIHASKLQGTAFASRGILRPHRLQALRALDSLASGPVQARVAGLAEQRKRVISSHDGEAKWL